MNDCYFFDKIGNIVKPSEKADELNYNNYELLCLIKDNLNYIDDERKIIYAVNPDYLLKRIYVHLLLQKNNMKYIIIKGKEDVKIYFKEKNKSFIILRMFLFNDVNQKKYIPSRDIFKYILFKIKGYPVENIRGRFIRNYIQRPNKKYAKKFEDIDKYDVLSYEKYQYKYQLIDKTDKFVEFNEMYNKVMKEGDKILKKILSSSEFRKYYDNFEFPIFDYRFRVSFIARDKIDEKLLKELDKFEKELNIQIIYD